MWLLFSLLSGFGGALLALVVKVYLKHLDPLFITFLFFALASLLLLIIGLITQRISYAALAALSTHEWNMLALGGIINAAAFTCYLLAMNYGRVSSVVAVDRLGVLYVVILSVVLLQEPLTIQAIAGAALMVAGVFLLNA